MPPSVDPSLHAEVAVVIPAYNCASTLAAAIESVLAQTYRDFRIFVIDDGSTDTTAEIMRLYSDRCVCLSQPNTGVSSARNRGILESSGKYIAFLDADDLWHPSKLERQIQLLNLNPDAGLVYSDFSISGEAQSVDSFFAQTHVPPDGRVFEELLRECLVSTPSVVVRRQVLEEVGLFNESLQVCEDMNLWLRIASCWNLAVIPEVLVTVRRRQGSLSNMAAGTLLSLRSGLASMQHIESSCLQLSPSETQALRQVLSVYYYKSGSAQLTAGLRQPARAHLLLSLRYNLFQSLALVKLGGSWMPTGIFRVFARLYHTVSGK